jgi:hypothetical protein
MDTRPLIHLWLNPPVVYGGKGYEVATMRKSVFMGDIHNSSGKSDRVWGNDYTLLDVWIDIDKRIRKMSEYDRESLEIYAKAMVGAYGWNWERWKMPQLSLVSELAVIACDILK